MAPRLLVTGPLGPHNPTNAEYLAELRTKACEQRAEGDITFLYDAVVDEQGRHPLAISNSVMSDLFRLADALLFPSQAEGFGIPLLEAGLSGLPIFCSELPVSREVARARRSCSGSTNIPTRLRGISRRC